VRSCGWTSVWFRGGYLGSSFSRFVPLSLTRVTTPGDIAQLGIAKPDSAQLDKYGGVVRLVN